MANTARLSNKQITILAIDPGETTGVCIARPHVTGEQHQHLNLGVVSAAEVLWSERVERFWDIFSQHTFDYIVIEDFRLFMKSTRAQLGSDFPSVRVIGIVEAIAHYYKCFDRLHFQMPAIRSRVQIDPRDAPHLTGSNHTKDAYRHLKYFVVVELWRKSPNPFSK